MISFSPRIGFPVNVTQADDVHITQADDAPVNITQADIDAPVNVSQADDAHVNVTQLANMEESNTQRTRREGCGWFINVFGRPGTCNPNTEYVYNPEDSRCTCTSNGASGVVSSAALVTATLASLLFLL